MMLQIKIKGLKLINTEHLKSCESPSIKASVETFSGPSIRGRERGRMQI